MATTSRSRRRRWWAPEVLELRQLLAGDAGSILFHEIMYHPAGGNSDQEFLELFNATSEVMNLSGWSVRGAIDYGFADQTLAPGQYLVIPADSSAFTAAHPGVENVAPAWGDQYLPNEGARLELLDELGGLIDRVTYANDGDWAIRASGPLDLGHRGWTWIAEHDGGGKSLELIDPALSNDYGQNWAASLPDGGTPGAGNSVADADIAPLITAVAQQPAIPASNEAVTVTARLQDEAAAGIAADLSWRTDTTSAYQSVSMRDDGQGEDETPGDGIYTASIPAQAGGVVVQFFVAARDEGDHRRTWPASEGSASEPLTPALYQVDDTFAAAEPLAPGDLPVYRLVMTEAERQELEDIGMNVGGASQTRALLNATLIVVDGVATTVRHNVGIGNQLGDDAQRLPSSYRVRVPADGDGGGSASFSLNTQFTNLQVVGQLLYQQAAVAAADSRAVRVDVNGQSLVTEDPPAFGSYAQLTSIDASYARQRLDFSNGSLYRLAPGDAPSSPFQYEGQDANAYQDQYERLSAEGVIDYSDVIQLTDIMNNAPDSTYLYQLTQLIDVDQWLRYFAVSALLDNSAGLAIGESDDAFLYRPDDQSPFELMPHNLNSLLGTGIDAGSVTAGIWRAAAAPALSRFLQNEQIAPRYYATLDGLIQGDFSAERFDTFLDRELSGFAPPSVIDEMKSFMAARRQYVQSLLPRQLTVGSLLPIQNGFPWTQSATTTLGGQADVLSTRDVLVNGQLAQYSSLTGAWSLDTVALNPGINRVVVEARGAGGDVSARTTFDIWRDDGDMQTISGTLGSSRTLAAADGPWYVSSMLTVPSGMTLTIEPGATLFFDSDAGLQVDGRIMAEGSPYARIRFTRLPTASALWQGVSIVDSPGENRLTYIDQEFGDDQGESINVDHSEVLIDHMTWFGTADKTLELDHPRLLVSNSHFDGSSNAEVIHGTGLDVGEYFILDGNVYDDSVGSEDDVVDFTGGQRPGPIFQVLNNVFMGGNDDGIDLDGTDAHVEGNVFTNFHREGSRATTSNAIATGDNAGNLTEVTVVRNIFYDNDHHVLLKEDAYLTAHNNVFYGADIAAIQFDEPDGSSVGGPGKGADFDGDIFWNNADLFQYVDHLDDPNLLTMSRSIAPATALGMGTDLISEDPRFVDPANGDFRLKLGSPAYGAGPNGLDMGALVPPGASLSGEPPTLTHQADAALTVSGPGITHYRYRVNGGAFGAEQAIDVPIQLTNLADGQYTVEVIGKNSANVWQAESQATQSRTWTVDAAFSHFGINELLVVNTAPLDGGGANPGLLELFNDSASAIDVSGMSITDDLAEPTKFVFAPNFVIPPDTYLVLLVDEDDGSPGLHLGFSLPQSGGHVYLLDAPQHGGDVIDDVEFGLQLTDLSIGRVGPDRAWQLTQPTLGEKNVPARTDEPNNLRINEWFTAGQFTFQGRNYSTDYIELFNTSNQPVAVGGLYLSDNPVSQPDKHQIAPLSFIAPRDFALFHADSHPEQGADHVDLQLPHESGWIGLSAENLEAIDLIHYGPQTAGVSQGRVPDGADEIQFLTSPTPAVDASPPSVPENVHFSSLSDTEAALHWQPSEDPDSGVAFYRVYRDDVEIGTTTETDFTDTGLTPGGVYLYFVTAVNGDSIESGPSRILSTELDQTPPTQPTDLAATVVSRGQIDLRWTAAEDPDTGILFYTIYRDDVVLGTTTETSFSDTTTPSGATLAYQVSATNGDNFPGPASGALHVGMFQNGVAPAGAYAGTIDTWINASQQGQNNGNADSLEVDGQGPVSETLIRWDLSSLAASAVVDSVALTIDITNDSSGQDYELYELLRDWSEGTATWVLAAAGEQWEAAGAAGAGDRADISLATFSSNSQGEQTYVLNAEGVAVVQKWIQDPSTNHGMILANGGNSTNGFVFDSSENTNADNRPRLTISFATNDDSPVITSVQLNAELADPPDLPPNPQPTSWRTQRSDLRSITVAFSENIVLSAADVRLTNLGVNAPVDADTPIPLTDDHLSVNGNVLVVSFAAYELPDGVYRLEILDTATDESGNALDGDNDGVAGGDYVLAGDAANQFYKLTADFNADEGVSIFDFPTFSYWFARSTDVAPAYVDMNQDGGISIFDFPQFSAMFGVGVTYPVNARFDIPAMAVQRESAGDSQDTARETNMTAMLTETQRVDRMFLLIGHRREQPRRTRTASPLREQLEFGSEEWESLLAEIARR